MSAEVAASGVYAYVIAGETHAVVEAYLSHDKNLKGAFFSASTLSRMCTGKSNGGREVKPKRGQLTALKLAILRLKDPMHASWSEEQHQKALQAAGEFAERVLAKCTKPGGGISLRDRGPRYARTVYLLSAYGEELLRQVEAGDWEANAKLALLHGLTGDKDDALFWSGRPSDTDSTFAPIASVQDLCVKAREYAVEYQRGKRTDVASIYLEHAAGAGDGAAALLRANQAELEGDIEAAQRWRKRATDLGCEGG